MSFKKNTIWNLVGMGLPLLGAAAFIPYCLHHLGDESFGVLTLIWALIGYFSLFDFGAGRALTYELSKLRAAHKLNDVASVLRAGLLLTALTGLIGSLIMFAIAPMLSSSWLHISVGLQRDAQLAFQIAALGVIPTSVTSGLRGAMEGLERFAGSNLNKIVLGFCMFCLPALSIKLHGNHLWIIAAYLVLARIAVVAIGLWQLRIHLFNQQGAGTLSNSLSATETEAVNQATLAFRMTSLVSYGFWVTISGIISPLMVYGDRFFVSAFVGADQLSSYAIPQEGLMRLLIIPIAICGALLPVFTVTTDIKELLKSYRHNVKRMAMIMAGMCTLVAIFAYPFLTIWISKVFADKALIIVLIMAFGTFLNAVALVPYTLLHAKGETKLTAQFHLFEALIYIAVLYLLAKQFGLVGAAFAWVLRAAIDLALLHFASTRLFERLRVVTA